MKICIAHDQTIFFFISGPSVAVKRTLSTLTMVGDLAGLIMTSCLFWPHCTRYAHFFSTSHSKKVSSRMTVRLCSWLDCVTLSNIKWKRMKHWFIDHCCLQLNLQCCMVRASTLNTLLKYHQSPQSLGAALRQSLEKDAVKPVLLDNQFSAIDRRVSLILQVLVQCGHHKIEL